MLLNLIKLFLIFFKIGAFTFGGGYAMIPMITQDMLNFNYLTQDEITLFIGIAESTPGPFAVNIATFAGLNVAGIPGAIVATLGVILPSFFLIYLIATLGGKLLKKPIIKNALEYLKPVVVALVFTAAVNVLIQVIFMSDDISEIVTMDIRALIIFVAVFAVAIIFNKKVRPYHLVILSAILGIIVYAI